MKNLDTSKTLFETLSNVLEVIKSAKDSSYRPYARLFLDIPNRSMYADTMT